MNVDDICMQIVDAAIAIHRAVGSGMLERTYEEMMEYELTERGLRVQRQVYVPLQYRALFVERAYRIDLLVNETVLIEVKCDKALVAEHFQQVMTYLRMMKLRTGFLLNFGQATLKAGGIRRISNGYAEPSCPS